MAGHVAEGAGAEVPPAAPGEGDVGVVIGSFGGGAVPEVPVQRLGDFRPILGPIDALRPDWAIGPDVDFTDDADGAGADDLGPGADAAGGRAVVAHLGGDLMLGGEQLQLARFPDAVREGLLGVDVFAALDGHGAG